MLCRRWLSSQASCRDANGYARFVCLAARAAHTGSDAAWNKYLSRLANSVGRNRRQWGIEI